MFFMPNPVPVAACPLTVCDEVRMDRCRGLCLALPLVRLQIARFFLAFLLRLGIATPRLKRAEFFCVVALIF